MREHDPLPSLESLRCFLAAAQTLNFRRAAESMHLTPAALGQRIKQLEEQMGAALFTRQTRRIVLTEAGQRLFEAAQEALAAARRCYPAIHTDEEMEIEITLGTRFELGMSWLLPAILAFEKGHPRWRIHLYFGSSPDLLKRLEERRLDGIVTSAPQLHHHWVAEVLHTEAYVFVGHPALLARYPLQKAEDAASHTLLDIDPSLPLSRYLLSVLGHLPFARFRFCGAGAAILAMARASLGLAVLPLYMVQDAIEAGELQLLFPERTLLSDSFRLLFDRHALFSSHLRRLAAFLREQPLR
jgi:DNA-binding transcriptional LysR family regulator